ncbi:Orn/Lys/Arg decarboxylase, C-terminal domain [Musa troglodytarum]|uniref:Orn/Lys/Arg decarboxylase, C-terminal domain n=1 Tax=Musa troglodytarum TaxID=320322 RepID=A0A9E7L7N1_9LILI|nr:Orn/Lys/Arg decarboxylase, C-terminal domain [Musa troglodytarum]
MVSDVEQTRPVTSVDSKRKAGAASSSSSFVRLRTLPSVDRRPSVHVGWRRRHRNSGRHRKVGSGIGGGGEQTTKSMDTRAHQTKKQATAESTEDDSYGGVAPCATNAPFVSALMVFAEREPACFCFPGHNGGKAASAMLTRLSGPDVFTYDSTPLPWLGNLFSSKGPLTDAQELAAEVFGSSETWFLVGGSNCGVMASIMATCSPGDFLVLPRNAHVSATHAMVLSGAIPKYITPEYSSLWDVAGGVTPSQFPGHNRGKAAPAMLSQLFGPDVFAYDLSPIPRIGNLFSSKGPLSDAQKLAAEVFGSSETWFLVGGSSCGVMASIMATCSPGDFLVLPRNSHVSATHAMVLSGAIPKYITPEYSSLWDVAGGVTPSQVETAIEELKEAGKRAAAVLITSPTYQGICSRIDEITKLCHSHGLPVIVDEAHGAHFKFHPRFPKTALEQGADLVVQSTHKVLSSLSQSSMLHTSGHRVDRERVRRCLEALQSTSSSYLLLASLDAARAQLSKNPEAILSKAMEMADLARLQIEQIPGLSILDASSFSSDFPNMDPLRVTVGVSRLGLTGFKVNELLIDKHAVIPEFEGMRSVTLVFNWGTSMEHIERLITALSHLSTRFLDEDQSQNQVGSGEITPFAGFRRELSPRDAFFAKKRNVDIGESLGEICGELICTFPPGVPVLNPGEVITREALEYLQDARNKGAVIMGAADPRLSSMVVCGG